MRAAASALKVPISLSKVDLCEQSRWIKYETSHLVCTYLSNYTTWKQVEKREWCNKGVSCGKCVMYKGSNDEDVAHEQIYREKTSSVVGGDHW